MKSFFIEPEANVTSTNGISVELHKYNCPVSAVDTHIHSSIEIIYILHGTLEITTNSNTYILNDGDLVMFRKFALHAINVISTDGGEYYAIKFHMSILNDFASAENINYYHSVFCIDARVDSLVWHRDELDESDIIPAINEVIRTYTDEGIFAFFRLKLNVGTFILSLMQDYHKRFPEHLRPLKLNDSMAQNIKKAIEFVNGNYQNPITARDAAKVAGLSYNYFSNCFSKVTGKTFSQYLNTVRINQAKYQLLISGKNISRISELAGFENTSYFTQEFRRQTGMTPSEFIKKYKKTRHLD